MSENKPQTDSRSASQKITDLENAMMSLYQTADNMARDLTTIKDVLKLLGNKVDSIIKASATGETVNDAVVSRIMIENNVEELKQKVVGMVAQGILSPQEQVGDDSFVVGSELNDEDAVVNPRLQFALFSLQEQALKEKIKGSRSGDVLNLKEGKLRFKVLETYQIQEPKSAPTVELVAEPTVETTSEVAATESAAPATEATTVEATSTITEATTTIEAEVPTVAAAGNA